MFSWRFYFFLVFFINVSNMVLKMLFFFGCVWANFCIPIIIAAVIKLSISCLEIISRKTSVTLSFFSGGGVSHVPRQNNRPISGTHHIKIATDTGNIMHTIKCGLKIF